MKNLVKHNVLKMIEDQIRRGFKPRWFVSYHYNQPSEKLIPEKELESHRIGFRDSDRGEKDKFLNFNVWNRSGAYTAMERAKNSRGEVERNTRDIKNKILKRIYGIKRLNKWREPTYPPMLFFHEQGKEKIKYHTHLVLPSTPLRFDTADNLERIFEGKSPNGVKDNCRSLSITRSINVKAVYEKDDLFKYLNKETTEDDMAIDVLNSLMYTPQREGGYKITSGSREMNVQRLNRLLTT